MQEEDASKRVLLQTTLGLNDEEAAEISSASGVAAVSKGADDDSDFL